MIVYKHVICELSELVRIRLSASQLKISSLRTFELAFYDPTLGIQFDRSAHQFVLCDLFL